MDKAEQVKGKYATAMAEVSVKRIKNAHVRKKKHTEEVDELMEGEDEEDNVSSSSSASGSGTDEDTALVKARPSEKEKELNTELKPHASLDQKLKEAKARTAAKLAALAEASNSFQSEQYPVSDCFHYMAVIALTEILV